MSLKVVVQEKVPEMQRTHIVAELGFDNVTPSNADVKAELAKGLKANPNVIVVNSIKTLFGESKAVVDAFQYDSEDALNALSRKLPKKQAEKVEAQKKAEAEAKAKAKAEAEAAAKEEAPAEEKPAEEKAEEKPAEEAKPEESAEAPAEKEAEPAAEEKSE